MTGNTHLQLAYILFSSSFSYSNFNTQFVCYEQKRKFMSIAIYRLHALESGKISLNEKRIYEHAIHEWCLLFINVLLPYDLIFKAGLINQ